jgi:uncharacterized membrane protein
MKYLFLIMLFSATLFACKQSTSPEHQHDTTVTTDETVKTQPSWKITGTEPFWNIFIRQDTILYTRLNDNIDSVYFTKHHFSDQDSVVEFHLTDPQGQEGSLVLRRGVSPCSDGMSDREYAYSAKFTYKKEILAGCAELIP